MALGLNVEGHPGAVTSEAPEDASKRLHQRSCHENELLGQGFTLSFQQTMPSLCAL